MEQSPGVRGGVEVWGGGERGRGGEGVVPEILVFTLILLFKWTRN